MATPKTLLQKLAVFQNDSFSSWQQKTDFSARELGDLNNLPIAILSDLNELVTQTGTVKTVLTKVTIPNVTLTPSSTTINLASTTGLEPQMPVSDGGVFITAGTKITSVSPTQIQISLPISSSASGTRTLEFFGVPDLLVGSAGTTFLTSFIVGDTIKITTSNLSYPTLEKRVVAILDNNRMVVNPPFETATETTPFQNATYENLRNLNLVSAINYVYEVESRRILVRAIAMS